MAARQITRKLVAPQPLEADVSGPIADILSAIEVNDPRGVQQAGKSSGIIDHADEDGSTLMHKAAMGISAEAAKALCKLGVDVDSRNCWGESPLHWASLNGDYECMQLLVERGADVNASTWRGVTPLHCAVYSRQIECVKLLLTHKAALDDKDPRGHSALAIALQLDAMDIVKELISQGADPDAHDTWGRTPLHVACLEGKLEHVRVLLDAKCYANARDVHGMYPMHYSIYCGNLDMLSMLLVANAGADSRNSDGQSPLHVACRLGDVDSAVDLIKFGNAVATVKDSWNETPLHWAACCSSAAVRPLLDAGAERDACSHSGMSPVHVASKYGNLEALKALVEGVSPEALSTVLSAQCENGMNPLHLAADSGHESVIEELIGAGADVEHKDAQGRTPVFIATQRGHLGCVRMLHEHGAQLSTVNDKGQGLMHVAHSGLVVDFLVKAGLSVTNRSEGGFSPVECGILRGNLSVPLHLLQNYEVEFNPLEEGATLLHIACAIGDAEDVELLITKFGCDSNQSLEDGSITTTTAAHHGNVATLRKLIELGASDGASYAARYPALVAAAARGHVDCIHHIASTTPHGLGDSVEDGSLRNALHFAALNGELLAAHALLEHDPQLVNQYDGRHESPLHCACFKGSLKVVRLLIESGAEVNVRSESGKSPLHIACLYGHVEIAEELLSGGADIEIACNSGFTALSYAVLGRAERCIELLLKNNAQVNPYTTVAKKPPSPLHLAATAGLSDATYALLARGASVSSKTSSGFTPLLLALTHRQVECAEWIVRESCNPAIVCDGGQGTTYLRLAARSGAAMIVSRCLRMDIPIANDSRSRSPFHCAAAAGCMETMNILLEHLRRSGHFSAAQLDVKDDLMMSPIHVACSQGHSNVTALLIHNGARFDIPGGDTKDKPIHMAAKNGHSTCYRMLVGKGESEEGRNGSGKSARELLDNFFCPSAATIEIETGAEEVAPAQAVEDESKPATGLGWKKKRSQNTVQGAASMVPSVIGRDDKLLRRKSLGKHGGVERSRNETSLHKAVQRRDAEATAKYCKKGDVNATDGQSRTALMLATLGGDPECVSILLEAKADPNIADEHGSTPLYAAIENNFTEIVSILLMNGANPNVLNDQGRTPMTVAAARGEPKAVAQLVNFDADINLRQTMSGKTPLHIASQMGHARTVKVLLRNKADAELQTDTGNTPLHLAAKHGHLDCLELLLDGGANPSSRGYKERSPLHLAAATDHTEIATLLLDKGADIHAADADGKTALHMCAANGAANVAALLLERGATVDAVDTRLCSALHYAAGMGDRIVAEALIKAGADVELRDNSGATPLHVASELGKEETTRLLLTRGSSVLAQNHEGNTPLHMAVMRSHAAAVERLMVHNAPPDCENNSGHTPCHYALRDNMFEIFDLLLRMPVRESATSWDFTAVDRHQRTHMHKVARYHLAECVDFIVEHGGRVQVQDALGESPLHVAAQAGNGVMLDKLLTHGADLLSRTSKGMTPFMLAVRSGNFEMVKKLIEQFLASGDVDMQNPVDGMGVVHMATLAGSVEILDLLLEHGPNVNMRNAEGGTPLVLAAQNDNFLCAKLLLECGADPNIAPDSGESPLQYAALRGNTRMAELLLEQGADPNSQSNSGECPLFHACKWKHPDMVRLLLEKGAVTTTSTVEGLSCLHVAAQTGNYDTCLMLLDSGADANAKTTNDWSTPLHLVCASAHPDTAALLLQRGANPNVVDAQGDTPMHKAAETGSLSIVAVLFEKGGAIDVGNARGIFPLHYACQANAVDVAAFLLENKASPDQVDGQGMLPLHWAVSTKCATLLVEHGAKWGARDKKGRQCVHIQAARSNTALFGMVLTAGESVNAHTFKGRRPLHYSAASGQYDTMLALLECEDTDMDAREFQYGFTALHFAVQNGYSKCAELLLDSGAHPSLADKCGRVPLHYAVEADDTRLARLLLDYESELAVPDAQGDTPLHLAVCAETIALVELLVEYGANLTAVNKFGYTPMHLAIMRKRHAVVYHLMGCGFPVEFRCPHDRTPLMYAAATGDTSLIHVLQVFGADVNAQGSTTPLHAAVRVNSSAVIELLLRLGASPTVDKDGRTLIHTAALHGCYDALAFLLERDVSEAKAVDAGGRTGVALAGLGGHARCLELMVQVMAEWTKQDDQGVAPLHWAASCGISKLVKELIARGMNPAAATSSGVTALHLSAQCGDVDSVELLLEAGVSCLAQDEAGFTPIHAACRSGVIAPLKLMLARDEAPIPLANGGISALHCAAASGVRDAVELIAAHCEISRTTEFGDSVLHFALRKNREVIPSAAANASISADNWDEEGDDEAASDLPSARGVVQLLLEMGADPCAANGNGERPHHLACTRRDVMALQCLLKAVEDQRGKDGLRQVLLSTTVGGYSCVHIAAATGQVELLKAVHAVAGDDIFALAHELPCGRSPIMLACLNQHADCVVYLCERGISVAENAGSRNAVLQVAAKLGYSKCLERLHALGERREAVSKGFSCTTSDGETLWHLAVSSHQVGVLGALCALGVVEAGALDKHGQSALDLALSLGMDDCAMLLAPQRALKRAARSRSRGASAPQKPVPALPPGARGSGRKPSKSPRPGGTAKSKASSEALPIFPCSPRSVSPRSSGTASIPLMPEPIPPPSRVSPPKPVPPPQLSGGAAPRSLAPPSPRSAAAAKRLRVGTAGSRTSLKMRKPAFAPPTRPKNVSPRKSFSSTQPLSPTVQESPKRGGPKIGGRVHSDAPKASGEVGERPSLVPPTPVEVPKPVKAPTPVEPPPLSPLPKHSPKGAASGAPAGASPPPSKPAAPIPVVSPPTPVAPPEVVPEPVPVPAPPRSPGGRVLRGRGTPRARARAGRARGGAPGSPVVRVGRGSSPSVNRRGSVNVRGRGRGVRGSPAPRRAMRGRGSPRGGASGGGVATPPAQ